MTKSSFSYLRLSLTDACNFNCFYCNPSLRTSFLTEQQMLSFDEMFFLAKEFSRYGVRHLRLTGGEPLLRPGVADFIRDVVGLGVFDRLSLTTNGYHLASFLKDFKENPFDGINVSLNTLKSRRFKTWMGVDAFNRVFGSILDLRASGKTNIKLNVILLKGFNDDEIDDFVAFGLRYKIDVRFIEYFPTRSKSDSFSANFLPTAMVKRTIEEKFGALEALDRDPLSGPAEYFRFKDQKSRIGFISPVTGFFCEDCNRLRLTADGKLLVCLHSDHSLDLKKPLREKDQQGLSYLIEKALADKGSYNRATSDSCFEMSRIGG